jgi:hypothetical protein
LIFKGERNVEILRDFIRVRGKKREAAAAVETHHKTKILPITFL